MATAAGPTSAQGACCVERSKTVVKEARNGILTATALRQPPSVTPRALTAAAAGRAGVFLLPGVRRGSQRHQTGKTAPGREFQDLQEICGPAGRLGGEGAKYER